MKMTNSLLSAYTWHRDCPPSWKDRAFTALKDTLTQRFTGTAATARGDAYEQKVNAALNAGEVFTGVEKPLNALRGMQQQKWLSGLTIQIPNKIGIPGYEDDLTFTFRGKMDFVGVPTEELREGWGDQEIIFDLKTTGSPISKSRYTENLQHIIYILSEQITRFVYGVMQLPSGTSLKPVAYMKIPIDMSGKMESQERHLKKEISGLVKMLWDNNLWNDYYDVFNNKKP